MAERRPLVRVGGETVQLPPGDTVAGVGGGVPEPPGLDMVYGVDAFGVPGWIPRDRVVGVTAWPTTDRNGSGSPPAQPDYRYVRFDDAEEFGYPFFDLTQTDRLTIPVDGLYLVTFSVSVQATANMVHRTRVFKNGSGIVEDLSARQSVSSSGNSAGSMDMAATSAPMWLKAGDFLQLAVMRGSTIYAVARSTFLHIRKLQ